AAAARDEEDSSDHPAADFPGCGSSDASSDMTPGERLPAPRSPGAQIGARAARGTRTLRVSIGCDGYNDLGGVATHFRVRSHNSLPAKGDRKKGLRRAYRLCRLCR